MTDRTSSLQARLSLRLATLFVLMFVAGMVMLSTRYRADSMELHAERLGNTVRAVAAAVAKDAAGHVSVTLPDNVDAPDYVVRTPDGQLLAASSPEAAARLTAPPAGWRQGVFTDVGLNEDGLVRSSAFARLPTAAGLAVIQVSDLRSDVDVSRRGMLDSLTGNVLPIMLPLMAAVLIIGVLTIRDSLAPMQQLARRAARISPTATDVRLPAAGLPPELKPMVVAINGALDRLDEGFRMQREFTADAAHELRTPLAILATHLDSLENKQVAAALRADVERMSRLVNQLLSVATLEALAVAPDEIADLQAIAVDVAGSLAPLALKRGRSIAVTGTTEPVAVRGNAESLRQALRNLIENALQHTPAGTEVEIEVTHEPAVHVSDRGPGVPPELRSRVIQRFWRADRRKGEGSGLGLAIVSRILAAHGGRLAVDDAAGGGARFSLVLPAKA
ncbi:MAG TPA: ATP-binding protein [Candidatus Acidoferrum sp.]|nr:ATP-binding protein [Candidatus Acidoferrum sp.]